MSAPEGKKTVLMSFDDELLLDARKALFRKNISLQQYVTYVLHRLVLADEAATNLLDKAVRFNEEVIAQGVKEEVVKIDPQTLYAMFERDDKKE